MNTEAEGKGPGYLYLWTAVALLFICMTTTAGLLGYAPGWGWIGADATIGGLYAWLMLRADWAK